MVTTLAMILSALPVAAQDGVPTRPGTFWTYRGKIAGKALADRWTVEEVKEAESGKWTLVDGTDIHDTRFEKVAKAADTLLAVREGKQVRFLLRKDKNGLRVYENKYGDFFAIRWVLPNRIQDGEKWQGVWTVVSCGFGIMPAEYRATKEKVTVPAGTFDALRVEVVRRKRKAETLWIVAGIGMVKIDSDHMSLELAEWGVPKGGR